MEVPLKENPSYWERIEVLWHDSPGTVIGIVAGIVALITLVLVLVIWAVHHQHHHVFVAGGQIPSHYSKWSPTLHGLHYR